MIAALTSLLLLPVGATRGHEAARWVALGPPIQDPALIEIPPEGTIAPQDGWPRTVPGDSPRRLAGPGMGPNFGRSGLGGPGYSATWYPDQPVQDQGARLGLLRQEVNLGAPVWRNDGNAIILTLSVRNTLFDTDAVLPETGAPFPDNLWNINFGLRCLRQFDNGWSGGLMTGFGSASDKPFHSIRETNVNLLGFLRVPVLDDRDSWMFSLMYAPASSLSFPIPGVAYSWNPSDDLRLNIGIPFSLLWRPLDELTIDASYIPLTNVNVRATYKIVEGLAAYCGYDILNDAYFLADREDADARFMEFEQRLTAGVRWDVVEHAAIDWIAGYGFGRYYGTSYNRSNSVRDRIDIDPGPFLGARLSVRF